MKISVIFGTRPEAIKLAPVILNLKAKAGISCKVCVTAQHRQMLDQVLELFRITPDADLDLMRPNQTLAELTGRAVEGLDRYLASEKPDLILVQGDTTTVFCAALAAFYRRVPVGHVEAGLRTGNLQAPWPEEANRILTTRLTALHFAPTNGARQNLLTEGVNPERIWVTGNTVIDALLLVRNQLRSDVAADYRIPAELKLEPGFAKKFLYRDAITNGNTNQLVLITGHRRESFGEGFENICTAIRQIVEDHPEVGVIYPVHLNPNVQKPVQRILGNHPRIQLIPPVDYQAFVWLMEKSKFILSDSGGVQEEAPSLGKPVLVMRETTERPEGIAAGTCRLVGTDSAVIVRETELLLGNPQEYQRRCILKNPYGDGKAAERISAACAGFLKG